MKTCPLVVCALVVVAVHPCEMCLTLCYCVWWHTRAAAGAQLDGEGAPENLSLLLLNKTERRKHCCQYY